MPLTRANILVMTLGLPPDTPDDLEAITAHMERDQPQEVSPT